jgi:hypothetical protein
MRQSIHELLRALTSLLPSNGRIVELGSLQHQPQRVADLRPLFLEARTYVGIDSVEGPGVDVVDDIQELSSQKDASADVVLCVDTLEHVRHPHMAMEQLGRVLDAFGWALVVTVFSWPVHGPAGQDLFRFTVDGLAAVLDHSGCQFQTFYSGEIDGPHTVLALCWKDRESEHPAIDDALRAVSEWCSAHRWTP